MHHAVCQICGRENLVKLQAYDAVQDGTILHENEYVRHVVDGDGIHFLQQTKRAVIEENNWDRAAVLN